MNTQQQRDLCSFHVSNRIREQAMHFSTVLAFETGQLRLAKLQLGEQRVVLMRELVELQFVSGQLGGINLAGTIVIA